MFISVTVTASYTNTIHYHHGYHHHLLITTLLKKTQTPKDNVIIAENIRTRWLSKQAVSKQKHSLALLHCMKHLCQMAVSLDPPRIRMALGSVQDQARNY